MKRPTEPTTIDDLLHPGERARTLDAQIGRIDTLLHALSVLDVSSGGGCPTPNGIEQCYTDSLEQPRTAASSAATGFPPHGHGHLERADSSAAPGLQAPITVAPASYREVAPFSVGDKGGYLSWRAAIIEAEAKDLPVIDAAGVCIWAPRGLR